MWTQSRRLADLNYGKYAYITEEVSKPVMESKLVNIAIKILPLVPPDGLHFNALFRQTGLTYKPDVVKALNMLRKSGLILERGSPTHKQKKIQRLTKLGIETTKLMSDIDQIKRSHTELRDLVVQKFGQEENLDRNRLRNRLISRNWRPQEADFYGEAARYGISLITESLNMVHNVLTSRYSTLLLKYEINGVARSILDRVMLDALEYHINSIRDSLAIKQLYYVKDDTARYRIVVDKLLSSLVVIEKHNPYHLKKFDIKKSVELLETICSMLEAPKNVIEEYVSKEKSTSSIFNAKWMQGGEEPQSVKGIPYKESTYKESRRISEITLSVLHKMLQRSA